MVKAGGVPKIIYQSGGAVGRAMAFQVDKNRGGGDGRPRRLSLVITTYNWPEALDRVLQSAARQTWREAEVIVADDGSGPATREVIEEWRALMPFPLIHAWQEDDGFRAARARNLAVQQSSGDYLVFTDGDCLMPTTFLADHARLARTGWFVAGRRASLNAAATVKILSGELDLLTVAPSELPNLFEKPSYARRMWRAPLGPIRRWRPLDEGRVETCNFALWARDLKQVKGFDESYCEFGHEDVDLAIRLRRAGLKGMRADFAATVMHLDHPRRSFGSNSDAALARVRSGPYLLPAKSMFLEDTP